MMLRMWSTLSSGFAQNRLPDHHLLEPDFLDIAAMAVHGGEHLAKSEQPGHFSLFHDQQRADVALDHQPDRLRQQRIRPDAEDLATSDLEYVLDQHHARPPCSGPISMDPWQR